MVPCAQTFVTTFGPKLYRRPLTPAEQARYADLFLKVGRADFKNFVYWATLTMLQSPRVLYRSELGKPDGSGSSSSPLRGRQRAGLHLHRRPARRRAAAAGGGQSPVDPGPDRGRRAQALVYDAAGKVKPAFAGDHAAASPTTGWACRRCRTCKKDATAFPDFNAEIQDALAEETRRFLSSVLFDEQGHARRAC